MNIFSELWLRHWYFSKTVFLDCWRNVLAIFLVQRSIYFPVSFYQFSKVEKKNSKFPLTLSREEVSNVFSWKVMLKGNFGLSRWVELVRVQMLSWQIPTRLVSQLPSSSMFEHFQHALEQTTVQEESLLWWSCCSGSTMCQASEPPLSPIPTNQGIHGVGFLPYLLFTRGIGPDFFLASRPERLLLCLISIPFMTDPLKRTERAGGSQRHLEGMQFYCPGSRPLQKKPPPCTWVALASYQLTLTYKSTHF